MNKAEPNTLEFSAAVIRRLVNEGVVEFCLASGSRNATALYAIADLGESVRTWLFIDERSAAFFALGRIKATGRPVAVVCTSGTAAAELLPAAVEAHYSGLPLVLLTCDRPRDYRGTGAPQSIEQVGLFGVYAVLAHDLAAGDAMPEPLVHPHGVTQVNLALAEQTIVGSVRVSQAKSSGTSKPQRFDSARGDWSALEKLCGQSKKPLVLLSELHDAAEIASARALAIKIHAPIYAEGISQLREDRALSSLLIQSGERALSNGGFDAVVRIGGVPTTRYWRDLDSRDELANAGIVHLSSRPFKGLRRGDLQPLPDLETVAKLNLAPHARSEEFFERDRVWAEKVSKLHAQFPSAEPSLVRDLSLALTNVPQIYLGNSLPIREWDLFSDRKPAAAAERRIHANRGANGIDGQVSTFFGIAAEHRAVGIIGDMTALYDLGAPWILRQFAERNFTLVVVNNRGGRIFSRVASLKTAPSDFMRKFLHQEHDFDFSRLAMMWDLEYASLEAIPPGDELTDSQLVELRPDQSQTEAFWRAYARIFAEEMK